jgi:hypothetical protein
VEAPVNEIDHDLLADKHIACGPFLSEEGQDPEGALFRIRDHLVLDDFQVSSRKETGAGLASGRGDPTSAAPGPG